MIEQQREEGQSVVIIALGLVALLAFMALAVDGGNIYAQQRQVQNAVDAAASAGGERLVRHDPTTNGRATNGQVLEVVKKYLRDNGVNPDVAGSYNPNLSVRYVTRDSSNSTHIDTAEITSYGSNLAAPLKIPAVGGDPVVGVHVNVDKQFNSFFASIIGIRTLSVGAPGLSYGAPVLNNPTPGPPTTGACCADELFPLIINQDMFQDLNGDGNLDIAFEEASPTLTVPIWLRNSGAPNFRFVRWKNQSANSTTLTSNMNTVANSGTWYVQEWLQTSTATMSNVQSVFSGKVGNTYTVPVYDSSRNSDSEYRIVGFARIELVRVCNPSGSGCVQNATQPHIMVKFEQWASSRCEGSCSFFGVRTNKPGEPQEQVRSLIGVVKIFKQTPLQIPLTQTPVDVVHVLDISGSMNYCIGTTTDCPTSPNQKLRLAKNSLITFNSIISPTLGDKVGLATFPRDQSTSSYSMPCGNSYSTLMVGQNRVNMTSTNVGASTAPYSPSGSVNHTINSLTAASGTPIAGGLLVGRQMVLNPSFHVAGHQPVIILASDGIANVRTNGRWTGFSGSTYSAPTCNADAVADAIAEANQAKQDLNGDGRSDVIIFSIAIGTDFNANALEAIASEPKSTHFYTVASASAMADIYEQIAERLGTSDCTTVPSEDFAPNAVVRVRNTTTGATYQTTTTSTGFFALTDIDPGTYEFTSVSVTISGFTYDIFTEGVGGPVLTSNPTIEVGEAPTTYPINLALGTNDFANSCD